MIPSVLSMVISKLARSYKPKKFKRHAIYACIIDTKQNYYLSLHAASEAASRWRRERDWQQEKIHYSFLAYNTHIVPWYCYKYSSSAFNIPTIPKSQLLSHSTTTENYWSGIVVVTCFCFICVMCIQYTFNVHCKIFIRDVYTK